MAYQRVVSSGLRTVPRNRIGLALEALLEARGWNPQLFGAAKAAGFPVARICAGDSEDALAEWDARFARFAPGVCGVDRGAFLGHGGVIDDATVRRIFGWTPEQLLEAQLRLGFPSGRLFTHEVAAWRDHVDDVARQSALV
jgi:hypothetical protein